MSLKKLKVLILKGKGGSMLRIVLMLAAVALFACNSTEPETIIKTVEIEKHDTTIIKIVDTVYLIDRPKAAGETDPPKLVKVDYRPNSEGFAFNVIARFDTVPGAAGYKLYYSAKETSDYTQLSTNPYDVAVGLSGQPPVANATIACTCKGLVGGPVLFFRASAISVAGKESKMSDFVVVVKD